MADEVKSDSEVHTCQVQNFEITTGLFHKNDSEIRDAVFFDPEAKIGAIFRGSSNYQQMEELFQTIKRWHATFLWVFKIFYNVSVVRIVGTTIHISRHGNFHVYAHKNSKISHNVVDDPDWVLITSDGFVDLVSTNKISLFVESVDRMTARWIDENKCRKDGKDASFLFIRSDRTDHNPDNVSRTDHNPDNVSRSLAVLSALVLL